MNKYLTVKWFEEKYKTDRERIKRAIELQPEIAVIGDAQSWFEYHSEELDKELIKLTIDVGYNLNILYRYCSKKFDKSLIRKAIKKGYDLCCLYKNTAYKFDKELIKLAIERGKYLWILYESLNTEQKEIFNKISKEVENEKEKTKID
jgi:hypothetical protein